MPAVVVDGNIRPWCLLTRPKQTTDVTDMKLIRPLLLSAALVSATLAPLAALPLATPRLSHADDKTLRLLVGFPAGGGTDAIARLLAEALRKADAD